jgi:ATP synthase F1 delta subunit
MNTQVTILARRYAQAYLNLFMDQISEQEYQKLQTMSEFIEAHRQTVFFLGLKSIPEQAKEDIIRNLVEKYKLPSSLIKLVTIIIQHGRAALIGKTLAQICELYRKKHHIMMFNIQSSFPLDQQTLGTVNNFLAKKTGWSIVSTTELNKRLIAGIRLQSTVYIWEYSIRKQINELSKKGWR